MVASQEILNLRYKLGTEEDGIGSHDEPRWQQIKLTCVLFSCQQDCTTTSTHHGNEQVALCFVSLSSGLYNNQSRVLFLFGFIFFCAGTHNGYGSVLALVDYWTLRF